MIPSLLVAAACLSFNVGEALVYSLQIQNRRELIRLNSEPDAEDTIKLRRKKKNKYEEYSATDKRERDPLDALIDESLLKRESLEKKRHLGRVPTNNHEITTAVETNDIRRPTFPDNRDIDPYDPTTYGFIELGKIIGAHGVHGFVKITAVTNFPERLCKTGVRHLKAPNRRSPRQIRLIEGRQISGNDYLIRLDGIEDRDAAMKLRDFTLYSRQEERPQDIADDEYLISDLVGMDVMLLEKDNRDTYVSSLETTAKVGNKKIGKISGIVLAEEMCSVPGLGNDILEVVLLRERSTEPSWRDHFVLIPFVPAIVPIVDLKNSMVYLDPPSGLLDLSYTHEENKAIKGFLPGSAE